MPRRMILTDTDRQNFLSLPTDDGTLIRYWLMNPSAEYGRTSFHVRDRLTTVQVELRWGRLIVF